ncbi:hypothetical protein JCM3765_001739 [Sporobolomyces pararoseus]
MSSRAGSSEYESAPPSPTPSERAAEANELKERLKTRLQYAVVKVSQSRTNHSVQELSNINFNPFAQQATARRMVKTNQAVENLREHSQVGMEEIEGESIQKRGNWAELESFEPYDRDREDRINATVEEKEHGEEDDQDSVPTPSPIYDLPPQDVPYLAICPAKPPSSTRGSSVDTVVEETQEEALQRHRQGEDDLPFAAHETDPQTYTATELMLSLRHGTSFTSSSNDSQTVSSTRSTVSSLLLPHKHDSPFSAHHPITTTLAPATSVSSLSLPAVFEPFPPPASSQNSSQNSNSHSFPISSQASFSALPPPPPLPFSDQPISSQQERQQRLEERNRKRTHGHRPSSSPRGGGESKRANKRKKFDDAHLTPPSSLLDTSSSPVPHRDRAFNSSSSPPPFPFSATQSSTNSSSQPDPTIPSSQPQQSFGLRTGAGTGFGVEFGGGGFNGGESQETEEDESQETVEESQELESQQTQGSTDVVIESQESVDD